jgi:hypothetical protein
VSADEINPTADANESVATTLPPAKRRGQNRIDWPAIEAAFVQGDVAEEAHEGPTERAYPTLADVAMRFGVSLRSAAGRSTRHGWVRKREEFQERFALELHRRRIRRMLKEADRIDAAALTGAKLGINVVLRRFQALQVEGGMSASESETLSRALDRFHKTARLALSLPTELLESAEEAERRRLEKEKASGATPDGMGRLLEKIAKLDGPAFLQAVDSFFGGTPAGRGQVIDVKALPVAP